MKRLFRDIYIMMLAAMAVVMAACSSDDVADNGNGQLSDNDLVEVRLHIAPATTSGVTRAWQDPNATDDEMMNMWVIVAVYAEDNPTTTTVNEKDKIAFIHASVPEADNREVDDLVRMTPGKYKFYSFANIDLSWINGQGLTSYLKEANVIYDDGTMSAAFDYPINFLSIGSSTNLPATPAGKTATGVYNIIFDDNYNDGKFEADDKTVSVDGNGFDPTRFDPDHYEHNGFDSKGIPMSNVQEITITGNTNVDLIVVRMMAKMELQFYNETGKTFKVMAATLSDITQNSSFSGDNLKLLPRWTTTTGMNNMNVVQHGDLQPNVVDEPDVVDVTFEPDAPIVVPSTATYTASTPSDYKMMFYINESKKPTNAEGLFYLTITLQDENGENTELRYSLISSQNTDASGSNYKWDYIARNDYRIIPIVIDDYKLELMPYDFPPIGVYPCSVREIESELYEMTFHDYGHFHLVPRVTKTSTSATVPFGTGDTRWTLMDGANAAAQWAASWKTAATKGGAWDATGNPDMNTDPGIMIDDLFYRDEVGTADGDEAGGVPVWYANDGTTGPRWDPAGGTTYNPFIFGYIAEPPAEWWDKDASDRNDRQVYHEFRVKLYVGGTYRRDLLYRFYMTLSKDQMLGAPAYHAAPRHRH